MFSTAKSNNTVFARYRRDIGLAFASITMTAQTEPATMMWINVTTRKPPHAPRRQQRTEAVA